MRLLGSPRLVLAVTLAAHFAPAAPPPLLAQSGYPLLAPYRDIEWLGAGAAQPVVVLGTGERFQLTAIDAVPLAEIVAFARQTWPDLWQKRFDEDLVEVLARMGHRPGDAVALGLMDPATGDTLIRTGVPMTNANRRAIMAAKRERAGGTATAPALPSRLSPEQVSTDLDAFQGELEGRFAYLRTNGVDYRSAIEDLRRRSTAAGMDRTTFGVELQRIVSLFIDGHAGIGGFAPSVPGWLPFALESTAGRVLAVDYPERTAFVDPQRPFLVSIDGRPLEDWVRAASAFVPSGSPQWTLRNALRLVGQVGFLRTELGMAPSDLVRLELASDDPAVPPRTLTVSLSSRGAPSGGWSRPMQSGLIEDGRIGYLRLASMNADAVTQVLTWMPRFQQTESLIIDVRGNTGGSRDALRALFPYLMREDDAPRVVNAARYRLHPRFGADHLGGSRYMYVESWTGWTPAERAAIARFKEGFRPEWIPPDDEFSDWHYLVMSRHMNPDAFTYDRPVAVLLDQNSFSATDIFVSALEGWRNVTLVGTPSGGGSARQVATPLPVSGLLVNLASMASFQWSGLLHDGNGTRPDVLVHPEPEYFLVGGRDNILEAVLELLRR